MYPTLRTNVNLLMKTVAVILLLETKDTQTSNQRNTNQLLHLHEQKCIQT